jgi:hypothetical protein
MKKVLLLTLFIVGISQISNAQIDTLPKDTLWKKGGIISLNLSQVALNNWAAGGNSSISFTGFATLYANHRKGKFAWDNNLDLGYGMVQQDDDPIRKNEDKIDFTSKAGMRAGNTKWFYSAFLNFRSQFANGFNFPNDSVIISKFMAPGYIQFSLGMDYKPNEYFSMFISPLATKFTIVADQRLADAGAYGVDQAVFDGLGNKIEDGKQLRSEFGANLSARFIKTVATNVSINARVELFSNYTEDPQNVDINAELLVAMKVNKYITASIFAQVIYDDNTPVQLYTGSGADKVPAGSGPRTQFKEVLGIGIAYAFRRDKLAN